MARKNKQRGGRPKLPPGHGRTAMLTARVNPALRFDLEKAAKRSGKTMSDEIEERLRRSFTRGGLGDSKTAYFSVLVARLATRIGGHAGTHWRDDRWTFDALRAGIPVLLARLMPTGDAKMPAQLAEQLEFWAREGMAEQADTLRTPQGFGSYMAFTLLDMIEGDMAEWAKNSRQHWDLDRAGREVGIIKNGDDK